MVESNNQIEAGVDDNLNSFIDSFILDANEVILIVLTHMSVIELFYTRTTLSYSTPTSISSSDNWR